MLPFLAEDSFCNTDAPIIPLSSHQAKHIFRPKKFINGVILLRRYIIVPHKIATLDEKLIINCDSKVNPDYK